MLDKITDGQTHRQCADLILDSLCETIKKQQPCNIDKLVELPLIETIIFTELWWSLYVLLF